MEQKYIDFIQEKISKDEFYHSNKDLRYGFHTQIHQNIKSLWFNAIGLNINFYDDSGHFSMIEIGFDDILTTLQMQCPSFSNDKNECQKIITPDLLDKIRSMYYSPMPLDMDAKLIRNRMMNPIDITDIYKTIKDDNFTVDFIVAHDYKTILTINGKDVYIDHKYLNGGAWLTTGLHQKIYPSTKMDMMYQIGYTDNRDLIDKIITEKVKRKIFDYLFINSLAPQKMKGVS